MATWHELQGVISIQIWHPNIIGIPIIKMKQFHKSFTFWSEYLYLKTGLYIGKKEKLGIIGSTLEGPYWWVGEKQDITPGHYLWSYIAFVQSLQCRHGNQLGTGSMDGEQGHTKIKDGLDMKPISWYRVMRICECVNQDDAHPINGISIEFQIRSKFEVLKFKICLTDHNKILHMLRQ